MRSIQVETTRRRLLQAGLASVGLGLLPRFARAAANNNRVLVMVFLRGGADGMSFVQPAPGTSFARQRYEAWRSTTRITNGVPLQGTMVMHPALSPLASLLPLRHMSIIPGVGGAQFNRSHFEQQDLVESGAPDSGAPLADGFLGRALDQLPHKDSGLSAIALSPLAPYSVRHAARPAVAIPDFNTFGALSSATYRPRAERDLRQRLSELYVDGVPTCTPANYCESGARAVQALDDFQALRGTATLPESALAGLPTLIAADTANQLKLVTVDFGGWDTHRDQGAGTAGGDLHDNIGRLAGALRGLYDAAQTAGVWSRITVCAVTEFGRTTRQNGTGGTDHGFGSAALVLGTGLNQRLLQVGYFPNSSTADFYSQAEAVNVVPRLIEHRQVFWDILTQRLEVPNPATVFPGFTPNSALPRVFV